MDNISILYATAAFLAVLVVMIVVIVIVRTHRKKDVDAASEPPDMRVGFLASGLEVIGDGSETSTELLQLYGKALHCVIYPNDTIMLGQKIYTIDSVYGDPQFPPDQPSPQLPIDHDGAICITIDDDAFERLKLSGDIMRSTSVNSYTFRDPLIQLVKTQNSMMPNTL